MRCLLREFLGHMDLACTFVRRYPRHDTRRLQFQVEDLFADYIKAPSTPTTLPPNAPPNVARFQISDGKRQLAVSDSAAQLTLNFGAIGQAPLRAAIAKAAVLMDGLGEILPKSRYYSGIVLDANFAVSDTKGLYENLSSNALRNTIEDLISLNLSASKNINDLQYTASVATFFSMEGKIETREGGVFHFDPDFMDPSGTGILFKYDVNSKPSMNVARHNDFIKIWENFEAVLELMSALAGPDISKIARDRIAL